MDTAVLQELKAGNQHAFMSVYERYHAGIYRFFLKYVKDEFLAEDFVHDVFIKLWDARQSINPDMPVINYLYRISRNHLYKELKKHSRQAELKAQLLLRHATDEPAAAPPEKAYVDKEYGRHFEMAISALSPQRQKVFRLCRLEGKTYDETAQLLGISSYTVKEHMSLAMKSIKDYLNRHADVVLALTLLSYVL